MMDWAIDNWAILTATIVPSLLRLLWGISQLTDTYTDDKIVLFLRKLWGLVPVGEMDPKKMGKLK
jgi:hypothetical protein